MPGTDLEDYRRLIEQRFSNPKIGDTIRRLCLDGSNRQPKFIVPTVLDRLKAGASIEGLALESALWCRYCHGTTDSGAAIEPNDPNWERLVRTSRAAKTDPRAWLAMDDIYGDVGRSPVFEAAFSRHLKALWAHGTAEVLTVMGGVLQPVRHRGRLRRVEWNFGRDPAATAAVVAGTDLTLVPLDVTVAMRAEPDVVADLIRRAPRLEPELARWAAERDDPVVLHDPLAFLVVAGEQCVTSARRRLAADAHDGSVRETDDGREQGVVVDVDAPAALDRVLGLLG